MNHKLVIPPRLGLILKDFSSKEISDPSFQSDWEDRMIICPTECKPFKIDTSNYKSGRPGLEGRATHILKQVFSMTNLQSLTTIMVSCCMAGLVHAQNFTIIAIPDTQHYTDNPNNEANFAAQTQWIVDNKDSRNIVFVTGLGDIVQTATVDHQWQVADSAYALIEDPLATMLQDGIPYGLAVGNHDQAGGSTTKFNEYFGINRFTGRGYYGGHFGSDNDNSYQLFSASGLDFIVIHLEYDTSPDQDVLDWADALLATYSDRRAIVTTHYMIGKGNPGSWGIQGQAIFNALSHHENLFLMLGGHLSTEGRREDLGTNGNTIHTLLSDYQNLPNGGDGWLRIMEFSPVNNTITVTTYSPTLDQTGTSVTMSGVSTSAPFILGYNMSGSTGTKISFQDGVDNYDKTRDTYIYNTAPGTPRGSENRIVQDRESSGEINRTSLLKFDISAIPAGSTILTAKLEFYVTVEGKGFKMHRMLKTWDEATITFNSIGGHFQTDDVDAEMLENTAWLGTNNYVGPISVTVPPSTIADWLDGTLANNGWLMIASDLGGDGQDLSSREEPIISQRPKLTVEYHPPVIDPTIVLTGVPLSGFTNEAGNPSATQSYQVSATNLSEGITINAPLDFEISQTNGSGFTSSLFLPESGGSVNATPIFVRFNRGTPGMSTGNITHTSMDASPQNVAVHGVTTMPSTSLSFQDGQNGYLGTQDTYICTPEPATPHGSELTIIQENELNGVIKKSSLLKFDLSSAPTNVTIVSAQLQFNVAEEGQGFNMFRMLKSWNEATETFNTIGGHFQPDDIDAESTIDANWAGDDDYTGSITIQIPAATIQDWLDGNMDNNGWLILASHLGGDGQELTAREGTQPDRPKLTIFYLSCSMTDEEDPNITCPPDINAGTSTGGTGNCTATVPLGNPIIMDNCSPEFNLLLSNDAPGTYSTGNTVVTWTVEDEAGNTATCAQNVTITDDENPTASCQDIQVQLDGSGDATITPVMVDDGSTDNCMITSLELDITSFDCSNVGPNVVILTATDQVGNSSSCQATVTIISSTACGIPPCQSVIDLTAAFLAMDPHQSDFHATTKIIADGLITFDPLENISFKAGTEIELRPIFEVELGATLTLHIEDCILPGTSLRNKPNDRVILPAKH